MWKRVKNYNPIIIVGVFFAGVMLLVYLFGKGIITITYESILSKAIKDKDSSYCNRINKGRWYGDYSISVEESIELCHAQYAIAIKDLNYCMTLEEQPKRTGTISQRDVCIKGLANKLKKPELCERLYSGKDEQYGATYIDTCKTQAIDPDYDPLPKETSNSI